MRNWATRTMRANTSNRWMAAPPTEVSRPSAHRTIRITRMVQSIDFSPSRRDRPGRPRLGMRISPRAFRERHRGVRAGSQPHVSRRDNQRDLAGNPSARTRPYTSRVNCSRPRPRWRGPRPNPHDQVVPMKVHVAKETAPGERRVALVSETLGKLKAAGLAILI